LTTLTFESVRKILIPIDGSDYSIRAAEFGISVAKLLKAEVTVIYVMDTIVLDQIGKVTERADAERELKGDGERYLKYIKSMAEKAGIRISALLAEGRPFEQIIHLAKGLHIDLIVMGTFGRRGAERILIGSVAERVIEYSTCPVLVVK